MNAAVAHRGPDDAGWVVFDEDAGGGLRPCFENDHATPGGIASLGHVRLAIVDLTALGHQPMADPSGRYWIAYNGEIYNHIELRAELELEGRQFCSHSDTEVILAAYAHWGRQCLDRFNGMFSFVLLDCVARRVFIARDRFGVKPLYYWRSLDGLLAIASEIKQFVGLPGWHPRLNGQRVYDFLNWGLIDHTEETLFSDVHQLRGGEFIEADLEEIHHSFPVTRWYHLEGSPWQGAIAEATSRFADLIEDSVRLRLRADVPVGSCLSGGLDSSSIVCIANRLLRSGGGEKKQHTFSARSKVERYDEGGYIAEVVQATGVIAHEITPHLEGLFEFLPEITWHHDEPFGSTSIYAQWSVFRLARENGIKVMLDGQGADELLAGYHGFFGPRLAGLLRQGRFSELAEEIRALRMRHNCSLFFATKAMADILLPNVLRQAFRGLAGKPAKNADQWLDMARLGAMPVDPYVVASARTDSIHNLSIAQLLDTNLPMLLHWEDRNSMAHGVESRVPFLDYRLVEFALGLPDEYKMYHGITKRLLRKSMRGILPELVRNRVDKLGFATPEETWLRQHAPGRFRQQLALAVDASCGILRPAALQYLDGVIAGRRPFTFLPWRMISFGAWLERFAIVPK